MSAPSRLGGPASAAPAAAGAEAGVGSGGGEDADLVGALRARVSALEAELADADSTSALRDAAQAALKQEVAELQRARRRGGLPADYLKGVVVGGFESGALGPAESPLLPVLSRLLAFDPEDEARIAAAAALRRTGGGLLAGGGLGGLLLAQRQRKRVVAVAGGASSSSSGAVAAAAVVGSGALRGGGGESLARVP